MDTLTLFGAVDIGAVDMGTIRSWISQLLIISQTRLKPGWVIRVNRVTFSPGHLGPTRFTNYLGLTRIGSREKRNCSFGDVETYKRNRVALS